MGTYTGAMVDFLRSNVDKYSWAQLTKLFNQNFDCEKNAKNIIRLCSRNEIVKRKSFVKYKYTDTMVDFLVCNINKYSWSILTRFFNNKFSCNKSIKNIMRLCLRNKIMKHDSFLQNQFTEEMINFLRDNYKCSTCEELAIRFNSHFSQSKTVKAINYHCIKNGFAKYKGLPDEGVEFLRANFKKVSQEELTIQLNKEFNFGKTLCNVKYYCSKYELRKKELYRLPVGSERLFGERVYVKVDNAKWKAKHHLLWEQRNGPIPKGCCVIFADGNIKNFSFENLALVTQRERMCLTTLRLQHSDGDLTKIGINIVRIRIKIRDYKNMKKTTI